MIAVSVAIEREWQIVLKHYDIKEKDCRNYPFGRFFQYRLYEIELLFYLTGTRKTNASAATQYIIDHFHPEKVIIMGTCAGIDPDYKIRDIFLPFRAVQVDTTVKEIDRLIREDFTVEIDLSPYDFDYETGVIGSGDKAVVIWKDYLELRDHGIAVADTESASIAYVCRKNDTSFVIIRGISDFPHDISNEEASDRNSVQIRNYLRNVPPVIETILSQYLEKILLAGRPHAQQPPGGNSGRQRETAADAGNERMAPTTEPIAFSEERRKDDLRDPSGSFPKESRKNDTTV